MLIEAPEISSEEQKRYAGKHVAIIDQKIVASGNTAKQAFQKAQQEFPQKKTEEIGLMFIPKEELMIL